MKALKDSKQSFRPRMGALKDFQGVQVLRLFGAFRVRGL